MMLMVVKIGRKLGLNTLWRCCKSWRISSHLKTDTYKVSSQVLAFLSWPSILLGFILDNFISKVYGVQSISLSYTFQHSPCFDTVLFPFSWTYSFFAENLVVLALYNLLTQPMLQRLNITWMVRSFLAVSWLLSLRRRTGRSRLIWGIGSEEGNFPFFIGIGSLVKPLCN